MARTPSHEIRLGRDCVIRLLEYGTDFSVGHALNPVARTDFLARCCAQSVCRGSGASYSNAQKLSGSQKRVDEPHRTARHEATAESRRIRNQSISILPAIYGGMQLIINACYLCLRHDGAGNSTFDALRESSGWSGSECRIDFAGKTSRASDHAAEPLVGASIRRAVGVSRADLFLRLARYQDQV